MNMAEEFNTSFIPKKTTEVGPRKRKASMSIFTLGGFIVFLIVAIASGGIFVYQRILERSIVSKRETLTRVQEAFEPSLIRELVRLDDRIKVSSTLLDEHIAPSSLLEMLERITLGTVRFNSFAFSVPENDIEDSIKLTMNGSATGFSAVALQSDEFGNNSYLSDVLFSNLVVTRTGEVTFTATAVVDPELFQYEPPAGVSTVPDGDNTEDLNIEEFLDNNEDGETEASTTPTS